MSSKPLRSDTSPTDDAAAIQTSESAQLDTEGEERNKGSEATSAEPDQSIGDGTVDESSAPPVPQAPGTDLEDDGWPKAPEGETRAPISYPSGIKTGNTGGRPGTSGKPGSN